jgi:hypothetical protein
VGVDEGMWESGVGHGGELLKALMRVLDMCVGMFESARGAEACHAECLPLEMEAAALNAVTLSVDSTDTAITCSIDRVLQYIQHRVI